MAAPVNHFKLGLFVIIGLAGALLAIAALGSFALRKETMRYHTYYNESVQGLEIGSPVKFRGVTIGHVATIEIAPDHRHVDVGFDLDVSDIRRLGLTEEAKEGRTTSFRAPPDLRTQIGSQGITGVKFVAIDFFDPRTNPFPDYTFAVDENHIPAAPSMMKNLEDTLEHAMEKLPELTDAVVAIAVRVDRLVASLEDEKVVQIAAQTLTHADEVLASLGRTMKNLERAQIPEKAGRTIDELHVAVGKLNRVLDRLDGDTGLLAAAQGATESFGQVGRDARGTTRELEQTLREVREAAGAIRLLVETLERDPDMLLKGRAAAAEEKAK
jgi:phospholipid/cholesterol/gamma-HCH transport system substrate-binding protein